ncbi:MAG TPA: DUF1508 domain-containing protein [Mycobacteriales bacterium]|nr:DUF1508 domain-containing protein [Mycobacteriales bacterium]
MDIDVRKSNAAQPYYFNILASGNNKELARSSENYTNKNDCIAAAKLIKRDAGSATIWDMTASKPEMVEL